VSNTYLKQDHVMQIKELARATGVDVELQRKVSHYLQPILSHRFLNNLA
jgi:hypothetical protein